MALFEQFLKRPNIEFVGDEDLRDAAFQISFEYSVRQHRPLSMVDCLIRLLLEDTSTRIRYLATFNVADFTDVCHRNRVEML